MDSMKNRQKTVRRLSQRRASVHALWWIVAEAIRVGTGSEQAALSQRNWFLSRGIRSASIRDVAIVGLYGFGLRRSELVRLDAADLHAGDGVLTIQGKGNELRNEDQFCAADSLSIIL
jgi:integrase